MTSLELAARKYATAYHWRIRTENDLLTLQASTVCENGIPCYTDCVNINPVCAECEGVIDAYTNFCTAKIIENDALQNLLYHARRL